MLAPIMPVMFLDTAVDSMLKGLGEQVYCAKVNTVDAALCLACVLLAVPRFGVVGYIAVIYASEGLNAALSIARLTRIAAIRASVPGLFALLFVPFAAMSAATLAWSALDALFVIPTAPGIVVFSVAYLAVGGAMIAIMKKRPVRKRSAAR